MEKKRNQKGFTLAELLIVVAIIAVLVAIAIPVFTRQLERSREATDLSNVRSAYAELVTAYLENGDEQQAVVVAKQAQDGWQTTSNEVSGSYAFIGTDISTGTSGAEAGRNTRIAVPWKTTSYIITIDKSGVVSVKN